MSLAANIRSATYRALLDTENPDGVGKKIDRFIATLIVLNLFALVLEHNALVYEPNAHLFHYFDVFSVVVFSVEYLLRLYAAPEDPEFAGRRFARLAYVKSPFAIIDLVAILPFYLGAFLSIDLRVLRALRLLRIFKLWRIVIPAIHEFKLLNQGKTLRQKVHALFFDTDTSGKLHQYVDNFIVTWVLISVAGVILESVDSIDTIFEVEFVVLDIIAVAVFSTEYIMRLYSCIESPEFASRFAGRFRYAKKPIAVIDLLAILPYFLEVFLHHLLDLRFLRIFRLMRLLKLTRYTQATGTLLKALSREWPVIAASMFIMLLMVVLTASLGYLFEHQAQPDKFENIPQSIYWAVVTLASVGYGDISPVTPVGRLMTIVMALVGIGIFAVPAAILSSAFNDQLHKDREKMHNELYRYLDDGVLDDEERAKIFEEAKRLHIPDEDVELMIERVRQEHENKQSQPLSLVEKNPTVALEEFRRTLSHLNQIVAVADRQQVTDLIQAGGRTTPQEREIWNYLKQTQPGAPPDKDSDR
ncbi:MAG: ion transporter [Burkholderiaceae bacterium]|nr:ion transporter [Betaproteobacteria bacterium]